MDMEMITDEVLRRMMNIIKNDQIIEKSVPVKKILQCGGTVTPMKGFETCLVEDYLDQSMILEAEFLVIGNLSAGEMAAVVYGLSVNDKTDAISRFLLNGKKVYVIEEGLEHRYYRETSDPAYYNLFRGHEKQLSQFGIRIMSALALEKLEGMQGIHEAAENNSLSTDRKLITNEVAATLAELPAVVLKKGTIITPSAKDVFKSKNTSIQFV